MLALLVKHQIMKIQLSW